MNGTPLPAAGQDRAGDRVSYLRGSGRERLPPPPRRMARRRIAVTFAKWFLPAAALLLLGSVALWPEVQWIAGATRLNMGHLTGEVEGAKLIDARYNGLDQRGRPYTVTAATAWQLDAERVALTMPKGDITLANGTWMMLTSKEGTYFQQKNQLDLVRDVTLYRDDGTTMHTASAAIDVKAGVAAGNEAVRAEGPFGVLDAAGGFTVMDKGAAIDFAGPAHVVLNGANP